MDLLDVLPYDKGTFVSDENFVLEQIGISSGGLCLGEFHPERDGVATLSLTKSRGFGPDLSCVLYSLVPRRVVSSIYVSYTRSTQCQS